MSDKKKTDILSADTASADELSAWARWQLPNMEADQPIKTNAYNIPGKKHPPTHSVVEPEEPEVKPLTAEDLESIRQAAYEDGLEQGREVGRAEGYDAGYLSGAGDVKASVTRLSQIARTLLEPIPQQDLELEQALLQMVEKICVRVVHRELSIESSAILKVVQEAIDCLNPGSQRLRIHLNKQDLDLVSQHLKEIGEWEDSWRIIAHPTITPGGCIIETDTSMIDARGERRLASVIQQVYERQQQALQARGQQHGHVDQLLEEIGTFTGDAEQDIEPVDTPESDIDDPTVREDGSESAS